MVATIVGSAIIISSCGGQLSCPSTSGALECKGASELEWIRRSRRCCTTETIGIRLDGSSSSYSRSLGLSLPQKSPRIQLSQTFVLPKKRAIVVSQASNPRVAASKQAGSKGEHDRDPSKSSAGEVRMKGKSEKQGKTRTNSPDSSSESPSTARQVVVKDGFAGLGGLKAQLEKERPRISRVNLNDVGGELLKQQKQAELRRRQEVVKSQTSPKTEVSKGTSPRRVNSTDGAVFEGGTLILVANLARQVTEEEYKVIMQSIPDVTSWKYLSDRGGKCLGYGFCEVQAESDIVAIIQYLSGQVLHGKKVKASLSEKSGDEYKQSLERQTRPAVTSKAAKKDSPVIASSSSMKDGVGKGSPNLEKQAGLRDVWKAQLSPRDSAVQNFTSSVMERDAGARISSTSVDSSQGLDNESATKLSGQSVMEALQRAATQRDTRSKPRKRKGGSGGGKYSSDSDSEDDTKQGPLPPLVFKLEWAAKIEELENDLRQLRMLS